MSKRVTGVCRTECVSAYHRLREGRSQADTNVNPKPGQLTPASDLWQKIDWLSSLQIDWLKFASRTTSHIPLPAHLREF